jgi:predicted lactoylglutathione lyase
MATAIFVNLPVKNLNKSLEFFTELGFTFNPQFTNEVAACMIVAEKHLRHAINRRKVQGLLLQRKSAMQPRAPKCSCVYLRRAGRKSMK